jgi:ADP-heptose:LPS heptosyltransferase
MQWLARLLPTETPPIKPQRIVLILPCCIGDVVMATATLAALRRGYPNAHITWAVGGWSCKAVEHHPLLDAVLDTGPAALPVRTLSGMRQFVAQLRMGRYDLAVSLVRSPLMSVALLASGIRWRAGLDSNGRGFGTNIRAAIRPDERRSEGDIYLDVPRALGLDVSGLRANVPVSDADLATVRTRLAALGIDGPYLVINPAGGQNPGMTLDAKRWPAEHFAALANRLSAHFDAQIVLLGGPADTALIDAVRTQLDLPPAVFAGSLSFGEIGALAREALVYIGNDTGLTHYAAAAGAKTVMILGPSDPQRYAPFVDDALVLWRPVALPDGGVASGAPTGWDWSRDGISVDEAEQRILTYVTPM